MGDPNRRNYSPASTALQIIETRKLSHHGKVTVHKKEEEDFTDYFLINSIENLVTRWQLRYIFAQRSFMNLLIS